MNDTKTATATTTTTGALSYFDVRVPDPVKGQAFFGALFGWQVAASSFPSYFMIPNADPSAG